MSVAECTVAGFPARLFRVSFTGELGFEVNVPARHGRALWEKLCEAGQQYDICPYGTETMHVLRAEKGYIIVGQDTDGTLTPDDAGLTWAIGKAKPDFVGKRSLARPDMVAKGRKQLVGLLTDDPKVVLQEGAQIVADPNQPKPMTMLGHVTSSYWSEALGRSIAMAVVVDGHDREGADAARADAGPDPHGPRRQEHGLLRPRRQAPQRLRWRAAMNAMTAPFAAGVTITELPPATRIALRLADREAAAAALGLDLPTRIGTRAVAGERSALCLGPDEWLIEAPAADGAALAATLADLATRAAAQRRRGLRPRDHLSRSKARPSSTCSPPAARSTSRGCRSATAPAPSSTPPRSC